MQGPRTTTAAIEAPALEKSETKLEGTGPHSPGIEWHYTKAMGQLRLLQSSVSPI